MKQFEIIYTTPEQLSYSFRIYGIDAQDVVDRMRQHYPFINIQQVNEIKEATDWH